MQQLVLASAIAIAVATPLAASDRWPPPGRYAQEYRGALIEHRLPPEQVPAACERLIGLNANLGCALWGNGFCTIVIIDHEHRNTKPAAVREHELGHCNGWPGDHPS